MAQKRRKFECWNTAQKSPEGAESSKLEDQDAQTLLKAAENLKSEKARGSTNV